MSQPKWTIVNGVKWSMSDPPVSMKIRGKGRPVMWIPENDVENPRSTFYHGGEEYVEICEISLEEAIKFIQS